MRIRKMNSVTGTHLLAKYGLKGVLYTCNDGKFERYICGCGNVSNECHCNLCGNEEYKKVTDLSSGRTGIYLLAMSDEVYTHKDDASIAPNVIADRRLSLTADFTKNKFFIEETYCEDVVVEPTGIRQVNRHEGILPEDMIESRKEDIMTPKQLAFYEEAKVRYEMWGIRKTYGMHNEKLAVLNTYIRMQQLVENGNITIPEDDIYKYRYLVFHSIYSNPMRTVWFSSIDDVIKAVNLPLAFKPYYEFNNSGTNLSFFNPYGSSMMGTNGLSPLLQNSFLFALLHGQVGLSEVIGMVTKLSREPLTFQEDFVEFFGRHVMLFKGDTLERFYVLREVAEGFPEQPAKFDMKNVSTLETLRYMKARGFNDTRAEMVMEALEKDPMVALKLLWEKKQVKDEERLLFDSL